MDRSGHFRTQLRGVDLKATPARLAILELFEKNQKPLSADDVFVSLKGRCGDRVTVYRTLKVLKERGVMRQIDLVRGNTHYELANRGDHHHLVCVECKKIEEISHCPVGSLISQVLKETDDFASVTEHSLALFGVCKTCAQS